jgi:pfkB family carbohydrate kinase
LVVATHGAAGVRAWTAQHALRVDPVMAEVVDTVGTGNTFQAALLAALAERDMLSPNALRAVPAAFLREVLSLRRMSPPSPVRGAARTCRAVVNSTEVSQPLRASRATFKGHRQRAGKALACRKRPHALRPSKPAQARSEPWAALRGGRSISRC